MSKKTISAGGKVAKTSPTGPRSRPKGAIPDDLKDLMSDIVKEQAKEWNTEQTEQFVQEFEEKSKSLGMAYLLLLLFGWHYVYLGNWKKTPLFVLTAGGLVFWWLADTFRLPGMVKKYNIDIAYEAAKKISPELRPNITT